VPHFFFASNIEKFGSFGRTFLNVVAIDIVISYLLVGGLYDYFAE
jgi:hypothetical protein